MTACGGPSAYLLSGADTAAVELALRVADRGYILESGRTILTGPSAGRADSSRRRLGG